MIRHLLKLAWNRKRSNALVILEVFASFLVVFAVVTVSLQLARNYRHPLGFSYHEVWSIGIDTGSEAPAESAEGVETFRRLLAEARATDGVLSAAGASSVPYDDTTTAGVWDREGRSIYLEIGDVTDEFRDVLGIELTRGRWFEPADAASAVLPLVIDEELGRDWFGSEDPLGKAMPVYENEVETRVVGVVRDFRVRGELAPPGGFLFKRMNLDDPATPTPRSLVLKVRPGLDARFEQKLVDRLQSMAKTWSLELRPLDQMREASFRLRLAPVVVGGIVAVFLLLMVALGLLGVLWQNVTRRTREIGLRRATGASRPEICRQILLEVVLTTTIGLALGVALVVQIPLLDLIQFFETGTFVIGLLLSAAVVYLLTTACGVYPALLAVRVRPAEALHQE